MSIRIPPGIKRQNLDRVTFSNVSSFFPKLSENITCPFNNDFHQLVTSFIGNLKRLAPKTRSLTKSFRFFKDKDNYKAGQHFPESEPLS